jgi:hypothetical protein
LFVLQLTIFKGKMMFLHIAGFCVRKTFPDAKDVLDSDYMKMWDNLHILSTICRKHHVNEEDLSILTQVQREIQVLIYKNDVQKMKTVNTHYLSHLAEFIRLYGPLRGYWCFPFESYLKGVISIIS